MDRERAETFLRLLVEAELRRVTARSEDRAAHAGGIARVIRVARALTAVGALGDEDVGRVLDDFELALVRRRMGTPAQYGRDLRWLMRSSSPRQPPAVPDHAVPGGQVIPVRGDEVSGEVTLLSYAQTESGALLTFVARPGQLNPLDPEGPWQIMPAAHPVRRRGPVIIPFRQFTATDDRGASYRMSYIGTGRRPGEWTLRLYPHPPRDLSWLDLSTSPGEAAVRIDLNPETPAVRPKVTVRQVTCSPAEQLLNNLAMRLLATGAVFPQDTRMLLAELALAPRELFPDTAEGLGDVVAALRASGALPPLSAVPGQLAALCARLNVTGHGLTVPPARDLPEPWLGVLAHHTQSQAAPEHDGCAAVAAVLPELDGTSLTILGLTSSADGTILHTHASGETCHTYYGPPEHHLAPAIWLRDSRRGWHATRVGSYHEGDMTMRLEVVPPLSQATTWIEVLAAGRSAEVRATLPLRWQ